MGGSAGGAVALSVLASGSTRVSAAAVVNPVVVPSAMIAAGERQYGMTYSWSDQARAASDRLNLVARAAEIAGLDPKPAILLVGGADDDPENRESLAELYKALAAGYVGSERLGFVIVPNMGHPLAEEPGIVPAPQTDGAARVDAAMTEWFIRHLTPVAHQADGS
jgi:alpha-beta hydrolase superfamily lysophospholipase